jgi:DNA-binding NarL/FixJ family response regulator
MKILVSDDDALIREGLRILLAMEHDMEVVGTAKNGQEALELCGELEPDIVLMDIRMPEADGIKGTKMIKERYPDIRVVMLTTFVDEEYIAEALKNGAEGYILKNQSPESIAESLRAVYSGNVVFDNTVAGKIGTMMKELKNVDRKDYDLTEKELEILSLIAGGLTNKELAKKLFLSEGTVRNYISVILEKLGLRDRTQLAIFYIRNFEK